MEKKLSHPKPPKEKKTIHGAIQGFKKKAAIKLSEPAQVKIQLATPNQVKIKLTDREPIRY